MFSSIKMKITFAVFALVMLSMCAAGILVNLHNEKTLKKTIFSEQNTLLAAAARHIDEYLFEALVYLDDTADLVTMEMMASPAKAQQFLDSRKTQQGFYNSALTIFDRSGTVIASSPAASNPIGQNFSHREYFQETVRTGKMVVSQPVLSAQKPQQIIIMFTSPLYDAHGKVAGVLGGAVSLQKQRYLQSLRSHKVGQSGYLSLYDSAGKAIMHPVPGLLLSASPPDSPVGRALEGYHGTEEGVAEDGSRVIRSVRRLQATDWILAVTVPVEEAYAPLYAARKNLLWAGVLASVLSALSAWHIIRTLLAPLSSFTRHLMQPTADGTPEPVPVRSDDEIGVMAKAFNAMISGMEESAEKIARLSRVIEQCPYTVVIAALDGTIEYANPLISERGVSVEEVTGRNLCTLIPDSGGAPLRQALARGEEWQGDVVRRGSAKEEWTHVSLSLLTSRSGDATHFVAIFKDITPRKEAEQALRVSEALHRQIFEENPQPMWVYDKSTLAFLAVNNAAVRHYGYSCDEFLGMTLKEIRPKEDVPHLLSNLGDLKGGIVENGVWRHVKKDGTILHVGITSNSIQFMGKDARIVLVHDLTAKKQVEYELRLSEERYRNIFDGVADVIYSIKPDGTFLSINRAFEATSGWPVAEWIGRKFTDLVHEEDLALVAAAMRSCIQGNELRKLEYRARDRWQNIVYLEVDATPHLENGEVVYIRGIARDITERKLGQQKQEYLQRRLSAMWNIAKMVDDRVDALEEMALREITSMTQSRRGFFGSVDQARREMTLHCWSAEAPSRCGKPQTLPLPEGGALARVVQTGSPLILNDCGTAGDDPFKRMHDCGFGILRMIALPIVVDRDVVAVYAVANKEGEYTELDVEQMNSFLKNVQIILEKRRAEESLLKLSHAINQSPVAVVITDAAGKIEFVNPRFTEMTGYALAEVQGKSPSILSAEQTPKAETEHLWETLAAGKVWNGTFLNRKKNGETFWGRATITSIRNKDNEITNYIGMNEDITERLQLEQQLRQSQKMEALGTLSGGIAHDFNNILTSITAYCALLEKMTPPEESRKRHYLEKVMESASRAGALTRSLLAYSRNHPLDKKVIDINDVLGDLHPLLSPVIGEDIEFRVLKSRAPMTVLADRHQMEQVLMNLCMNGRDAMPEGGVLKVEVERVSSGKQADRVPSYLPSASYVRLAVSDTGTGIDPGTRERIFEPFFTTKEVDKGTGLGLSIVYGIVNQHQGYVDVWSEPGQGAVFSIYLPVADPCVPHGKPSAGAAEQRGHGTILLVEDETEIRAPLKELLEEKGYRVIEARDGEEATAKYRMHSSEVKLVILDVVMPKKNGRQAYEEMRQITQDVKVLFISGYTSDILSSKGFSGDEINFISKPIKIDPLLSKIGEVMQYGR